MHLVAVDTVQALDHPFRFVAVFHCRHRERPCN